jgi:hypothetical protein
LELADTMRAVPTSGAKRDEDLPCVLERQTFIGTSPEVEEV